MYVVLGLQQYFAHLRPKICDPVTQFALFRKAQKCDPSIQFVRTGMNPTHLCMYHHTRKLLYMQDNSPCNNYTFDQKVKHSKLAGESCNE